MNATPDESLEHQIRAYLAHQAMTVDANRIWHQIQSHLEASSRPITALKCQPDSVQGRLKRTFRWSVALAAGILLLVLSTLSFTGQALAETVLRQTTRSHEQPIDRLYKLEITPDPSLKRLLPQAEPLHCQISTRGDRFWVNLAGQGRPWQWGRDIQRRVWIVLHPQLALRFDVDEIPEQFNEFFALRAADIPAILRDVLQHCALTDATITPTQRVIQARHRPHFHPFPVISATLDIDPQRLELRSLTLTRGNAQGRPLGEIHLSLLHRESQSAQRYEVEDHLRTPFEIVDRKQPGRRLLLLANHLQRTLFQPLSQGSDSRAR